MQIKKVRSLMMIFFLFFAGADLFAGGDKEISAEQFKWMSETSTNIVGKFKEYNRELDKYEPYFFLDYDQVLTPGYEYTVPTPAGNWNVGPIEGNMGFYAGYKFLGLMGVVNGINLLIDDKHKTGQYAELSGWANYYYILGLRLALSRNFQFFGGGILKRKPYFIEDSDGQLKFAAYYDSDGILQTNDNEIEMIFMIKLFGYDFGTIFNYDNKNVSTLSLDKDILKSDKLGTLNLNVNYFDLDKTFQAGYKIKDLYLSRFISLGSGGLFNAYSQDDNKSVLASVSLYDTLYLFKKSGNSESGDSGSHDFYMGIRTGASVTRDLFDEYLYGFIAEVSAENIILLGVNSKLTAGLSYNYEETLKRLPIKDQLFLSFKIRVLF